MDNRDRFTYADTYINPDGTYIAVTHHDGNNITNCITISCDGNPLTKYAAPNGFGYVISYPDAFTDSNRAPDPAAD
jgi:hypothetical protein